jgi:hypothetical protein
MTFILTPYKSIYNKNILVMTCFPYNMWQPISDSWWSHPIKKTPKTNKIKFNPSFCSIENKNLSEVKLMVPITIKYNVFIFHHTWYNTNYFEKYIVMFSTLTMLARSYKYIFSVSLFRYLLLDGHLTSAVCLGWNVQHPWGSQVVNVTCYVGYVTYPGSLL